MSTYAIQRLKQLKFSVLLIFALFCSMQTIHDSALVSWTIFFSWICKNEIAPRNCTFGAHLCKPTQSIQTHTDTHRMKLRLRGLNFVSVCCSSRFLSSLLSFASFSWTYTMATRVEHTNGKVAASVHTHTALVSFMFIESDLYKYTLFKRGTLCNSMNLIKFLSLIIHCDFFLHF